MKHPAVVYRQWVEMIQTEGRGLTKWEEDFVSSIEEQLQSHGISERQAEILERIYAEKTS